MPCKRGTEWDLLRFIPTEAPAAEGKCWLSRGCGESLDWLPEQRDICLQEGNSQ